MREVIVVILTLLVCGTGILLGERLGCAAYVASTPCPANDPLGILDGAPQGCKDAVAATRHLYPANDPLGIR